MKHLFFTLLTVLFSVSAFAVVGPIIGPTSVCTGHTIVLTDTTAGGVWTSDIPGVATIDSSTGIVTALAPGTVIITYTTSTGFVVAPIIVNVSPGPITGPASLCTGASGALATSIPGGTWSNSNPAVAAIGTMGLVGISPGTTTITYSFGSGCAVTKTVTVDLSPASITGPTSVCVGSVITLTNATPGGTWNNGSSFVAIIDPAMGVLTGTAPGTVIVTYAATTGCNASATITVNPLPAAILGPSSVCIGNSITLTSSVGTVWSSVPSSIATINITTGVVIGLSLGMALISSTSATGCITTTSINVTPSICSGTPSGGLTTISSGTSCAGLVVIVGLSGASIGCGFTYQWQNSPDGTTYTDVSGATNATYGYTVTATSYFKCKITCVSSGLSAFSTPGIVRTSYIGTHSTAITPDIICRPPDFYISACSISSSYNVTTWFGDGSSVNTPLTSTGVSAAHVLHDYDLPGTYRVKQVLNMGTTPIDTLSFSYEHLYCNTLPIKFYFDANSNNIYDLGDKSILLPLKIRIDSNGIPVDTVSATSGLYYKAHGAPGTIYSFRIISAPAGLLVTAPSGGVLYDTIQSTVNDYHAKYFGLNCTSSTSFDLVPHVSTWTGRHAQAGTILVSNPFCVPQDADVTLHFNPRYHFTYASPAPVSYTASTATWHLTGISTSTTTDPQINYHLDLPLTSTWFLPGDTVHSNYITIATGTGDLDTSNNVLTKIDTVRSSYDPNDIAVSPKGNVLPCTKLQYTIRFENDGNDTARDIYVLDTLSDNLDPSTLNIEIASAAMNIAIINDGVRNIVKFDFPGINLPDSSHHGLCHGMLIYNIKTKPGLSDGTPIPNRAGIYFDDNPVVLTNTIQNTIGISPITGPSNVCTGANLYLGNATENGTWSSSNTSLAVIGSATGIVNGLATGTPVISYSLTNSCGTRSVTQTITVNPLPASITGTPTVCTGSTTNLSNTSTGGTWASSNTAVATVGAGTGIVTGITADTAIITYLLPTGCKATQIVTVNVPATPITGSLIVCPAATTTLADATTGGTWSSSSTAIATIGSATGIVMGMTAGTATISYTLSTGCIASAIVTVNPLPTAFIVTGGGNYCAGGTGVPIGIAGSVVGTNYSLHLGTTTTGPISGTGSALSFGLQTVAGSYTATATNTATACQGSMTGSAVIAIDPIVVPAVSLTASPGINVCEGTAVSFTPVPVNGGPAPDYLWNINGINVATGNSYSFLPANGDIVKVQLTSHAYCAAPDTASTAVIMDVNAPALAVTITAAPGLYIVVGQSDTFTAVVTGGGRAYTYQWLINGSPIPGAASAIFVTNTLYDGDVVTCAVTDNGPCTGSGSASATITLNNVGIRHIQSNGGLTLFPNPNKGSFTIKGAVPTLNSGETTIEVTNILGQTVYKSQATINNGNIDAQISPGNTLADGIYILILHNGIGKEVIHFVVGE